MQDRKLMGEFPGKPPRSSKPRARGVGPPAPGAAGADTHRSEECAEAESWAFGLSPSTVLRRFIRASARKLQELAERRLDGADSVALFLDGKSFAEDELVIALGITGRGENVILGFVQTATENKAVLTAFLRQLASRSLRSEQGLLSIIDGAKGLRAAIRRVFGPSALGQRCQRQKRESLLICLPKAQQGPSRRRKLQAAWEQPTYAEAKAALDALPRDLRRRASPLPRVWPPG